MRRVPSRTVIEYEQPHLIISSNLFSSCSPSWRTQSPKKSKEGPCRFTLCLPLVLPKKMEVVCQQKGEGVYFTAPIKRGAATIC